MTEQELDVTDCPGSIELLSPEGGVECTYPLAHGGCEIGREGSGIQCADDPLMAPRHASLVVGEESVVLADLGEGSGVWLRLRGAEGRLLEESDQLWLGAQLLLVRRVEDDWQIRHHGPDGRLRERHSVPAGGVFIGRTSDLVLDPEDGQLSRRHAQIVREGDCLRFYDRGAHNGSYLRITGSESLSDGDEFRAGGQRFRFVAKPLPVAPESPPVSEEELGGVAAGVNEELNVGVRDEVVEAATGAGSAAPGDSIAVDPDSEATVLSAFDEDESEGPAETVEPDESGPLRTPPVEKVSLASRLRRIGRRSEPAPGPAQAPEAAEVEPGQAQELSAEPDGDATTPRIEPEPEPANLIEGDATVVALPLDDEEEDAGAAVEPSVPEEVERVLVVIDSDEGSLTLEAPIGATILEAVQASGAERGAQLDWECGDGGCGVCILGVVEGADRMDPPDPATGEMKTIQITEQVAPDPNRYRLACLARVRGAVRLRKLT